MAQPVGAANRQDLFTPQGSKSGFSSARAVAERPPSPANNAGEDPLELEHVIGYTGRGVNTLWYNPAEPDMYITR